MKYWQVAVLCFVGTDIAADKPSYESNYVIEGNAAVDQARARLSALEDELQWLVSYYQDCAEKSDNSDPKDSLKSTSLHLPADIKILQEAFSEFSKEMWRSIGAIKGPNPSAFAAQTASFLELANWYASFIEENLFPQGWQKLYQDYIQKQTNAQKEASEETDSST
jgi:hypothetical protein